MYSAEIANTESLAPRDNYGFRNVSNGANDLSTPSQFLDHSIIEWDKLLTARYWMEQSFEYTYPGPIHDLRQRLIAVPPDYYGDQHLIQYELLSSSPLATTTTEIDGFGNRVIRIAIPKVSERVTFDMRMVIERDLSSNLAPVVSVEDEKRFRVHTHLTEPDSQIEALAKDFLERHSDTASFGEALNSWIYATMRYGRGATTVLTTAAEALQTGQGLCQDYAHIMLAICRTAGFSARYVSGHLLGEGRSHAWVELLLPDGTGNFRAIAFDPTNHRRTTPAYLTIAVGRDYNDISPTSGTFTAPYPGRLHAQKRAGITDITLRRDS